MIWFVLILSYSDLEVEGALASLYFEKSLNYPIGKGIMITLKGELKLNVQHLALNLMGQNENHGVSIQNHHILSL